MPQTIKIKATGEVVEAIRYKSLVSPLYSVLVPTTGNKWVYDEDEIEIIK
jgi:hypothetical protein